MVYIYEYMWKSVYFALIFRAYKTVCTRIYCTSNKNKLNLLR